MAKTASMELTNIYVAHGNWLTNWLRWRTRCPERAADLTQDTFCRALEAINKAPIDNPRSYLVTVARRLLIDDVRRRQIESAYLACCGAIADHADLLTPDRIAEAVEMLEAILKRLEGLPAKVRRGFVLIRLDGLSYAQAACELGVSDRMVKKYVAQAYTHFYHLTDVL